MDRETDIRYMSDALSLAAKGRGTVSPNPMVGSVIVKDDTIIGSGYHMKAGEDHAEIIALREAGAAAKGSTLYVTLEPCCHHGKTPPCTDAIIKSGVTRVVAAMRDANPLVGGKGCAALKSSGISVDVGILEDRARRLNEAFLKFIATDLPFVTLKLASTLDGRIADSDGKSKWITGPETRKRVHQLRAWSDAIMVGVGTVLADDPSLNVRDAEGDDPLKVIVDSRLRTPIKAKALADRNVVLAVTEDAGKERIEQYADHGITVAVTESVSGSVSLEALMKYLGERSVTSVLCEGGGILSSSLLSKKLVDKMMFTFAPKILGAGLASVADFGVRNLDDALNLRDCETETVGDDVIITGYPEYL